MNEVLQAVGEDRVAGFMLVLARISPLFILAPLFSSKSFSPRVRGIAAVALTFGIAPVAMGEAKVTLEVFALLGLMLKELLVGLAFAFAVGALFQAVTVAGTLLDTVTGFAFGAQVDPLTGSQSAVLSQLYSLIAIAIFVAIGGDAWVIEGLARTYDTVPLHALPDLDALVGAVVAAFAAIFVSALQVAAPVMLALVLTDAGFGIVSRVVPQMNVFAVGFPTKVLVGLLIVGASLPFMAGFVAGEVPRAITNAMEAVR